MRINVFACCRPLGDCALTLTFGTKVDRNLSARVLAAAGAITAAALPAVREVVPAFAALTVHYDPAELSYTALAETIGSLDVADAAVAGAARTWHIPVLYGGAGGPDLADVAAHAGLGEQEAAALHASTRYHVYMLGFLPGFAYLGDCPQPLRLPRLAQPRTRVPPGSLAIAEEMTAVYPSPSPGGWRLIGQTPVRFFDATATPPSLFAPGDAVHFEAVSPAEFSRITDSVESGSYRVVST